MAGEILSFLLEQEVGETYSLSFDLEQQVITGNVIGFSLKQTVGIFSTISFDLQQEVEAITGQISFSLEQEVITGSVISFNLAQSVLPEAGSYTSGLFSQAQYIGAAVSLDSSDISDVVTGQISVQMEEGTARLATVSYFPPAGNINKCELIGKSVEIDVSLLNSNMIPVSTFRRFTGEVKSAEYDVTNTILTLSCTDNLQDDVAETDKSVLDSMIQGHFSSDVYEDEEVDNWDYAQDQLLTVPKSMDKDVFGTLRVTDWLAKGTADYVLLDEHVTYQTPQVALANSDELVNKVNVELDNRFSRQYHREVKVGWVYPRSFCAYIGSPTELPSKSMVTRAFDSVGWDIKSLTTTPLGPSGLFKCIGNAAVPLIETQTLATGQFAWFNPYYPDLLTSFSALVYKRWEQTITERITHVVTAPQSINTCGEQELTLTSTVSIESEEDLSSSSESTSSETVLGSFANSGNGCNISDGGAMFGSSDVQPQGGYGVSRIGSDESRQPPVGSVLNSLGDYVLDVDDQDRYEAASNVVMAQAIVKILESHRKNYVQFSRPFIPVDVNQTIEVNATNVHAMGKVHSITEVFDIDSGSSVTSIRIAISKSSSEAVAEQVVPGGNVVLPSRISSSSYLDDLEQPNKTVSLPTQLGNKVGETLAYCEDKLGFSGNYHYLTIGVVREDRSLDLDSDGRVSEIEALGGSVQSSHLGFNSNDRLVGDTSITGDPFPHRLTIELDGVQQELTDAVEVEGGDAYTTQIPDELLLIN